MITSAIEHIVVCAQSRAKMPTNQGFALTLESRPAYLAASPSSGTPLIAFMGWLSVEKGENVRAMNIMRLQPIPSNEPAGISNAGSWRVLQRISSGT